MKKKYLMFLSILPAFLWIVLIYYKTGILFETNDDRYISEILSGALTGTPTAHTTYVNYLLCLPLMFLYRITANIAWYGILLIVAQVLCYSILIYAFYTKWKLYSLLFFPGVLCSGLYITGFLQYTSTAALLAVTGYVALLMFSDSKTKYSIFFLCELFAFLLRYQAMLMIQPLGLLTFYGLLLTKDVSDSKDTKMSIRSFFKNNLHPTLFPAVLLFFTMLIGLLGNQLGYHSSDWKEYIRFNDARTELLDYYGTPDYSSAKSVLDNYNVSEAEYLSFCNLTILEGNISADCLQELAALSKEQYYSIHNPSITDSITSSITNYLSDGHWLINRIPIILWIGSIIALIVLHKFTYIIPLIGLFLGRTITWSYLLYRGRIPSRVSIPIYICEIIFLIVIFSKILPNTSAFRKPSPQFAIATLTLGLLFMAIASKSCLMQYSYVKQTNQTQTTFDQGFEELQDYCLSHPDNIYLIEAQALGYYKGNALSPAMYQPRNSLASGCWYSQSPHMVNAVSSYIGNTKATETASGNTSLYFIAADGEEERITPILTYLSEYTGHSYIVSDQFTVSHGGTYLVYCYR
ncbi:MAG: hypothetical protein E7299_00470 [Lachnospiraceae bacterium]|nr:hypothetical protein [Lachnospiraceae bacterium]